MNVAPIFVIFFVVTSLLTSFALLFRSRARITRMTAAEAGDKETEHKANRLVNGWPYVTVLFGFPTMGLFALICLILKDFLPAGSGWLLLGFFLLPILASVFVSIKERQYQASFSERFQDGMKTKMKRSKARLRR